MSIETEIEKILDDESITFETVKQVAQESGNDPRTRDRARAYWLVLQVVYKFRRDAQVDHMSERLAAGMCDD